MNLHGIVAPIIGAVNPLVNITLEVSTGSTLSADGIRVPTYAKAQSVQAQVQPLSGGELRHLDSLELQGDFVGFYLFGEVSGIVRVDNQGGDKLTFPNGRVYLVTLVLESWPPTAPEWCKVVGTLQNNS